MQDPYAIDFLAPFSPLIVTARIPPRLIREINAAVDAIVANNAEAKARDWSEQLAGNVARELNVSDKVKDSLAARRFLLTTARAYLLRCSNPMLGQSVSDAARDIGFRVSIAEAWVNEMVAGDFSPLHFHSNCQLSCVGFLRLPVGYEAEFSNDKRGKESVGCLQFIDSRTTMGAQNMFMVKPEVGKFYLFPSWMLHCVYPFRCEGVRRSISANLTVASRDSKTDEASEATSRQNLPLQPTARNQNRSTRRG